MDPQKRVFLVFDEKPPQKNLFFVFWLWFSLNTIYTHMFFFLFCIFENGRKKVVDRQNSHFGRVLAEEILFKGFYFKTWKCTFLGVTQFVFHFFPDSALKTKDAQMLFRSQKILNIWAPWKFFENENFDVCAPVRGSRAGAEILDLDFF